MEEYKIIYTHTNIFSRYVVLYSGGGTALPKLPPWIRHCQLPHMDIVG